MLNERCELRVGSRWAWRSYAAAEARKQSDVPFDCAEPKHIGRVGAPLWSPGLFGTNRACQHQTRHNEARFPSRVVLVCRQERIYPKDVGASQFFHQGNGMHDGVSETPHERYYNGVSLTDLKTSHVFPQHGMMASGSVANGPIVLFVDQGAPATPWPPARRFPQNTELRR